MAIPAAAVAGANLALSVGGAVLGKKSSDKARRQEKKRQAMMIASANKAYKFELGDIAYRQGEEILSSAIQSNQRLLKGLQEKALARVAAAEAGVSGLSVDRILDDIGQQAAKDQTIISRQLDATSRELDRSRERAEINRLNRIAGVSTLSSNGTSNAALGLNVLSSALDSFVLYNQLKPE